MWLKFKNVATPIIETFYLLTITILLGNPFNVKQIDNIFVMASMENSIFTSIMLNDVKGAATNKTSNATVITTAFPSRPTTTTTSTSLAKSWFNLEKNDFTADNRIFNSTFKKTIHKNASNDIETLNDDSENYERGLSSSYFMTKQSSSFSKSIQQPATTMITTGTVTTTAAAGTMTTKLLTPTKFNTTKILTSTTGKLLSFSTSSLSPLSSTLSSTLPDNEELNGAPTRLLLNKTQIDVLASYSLLSSTLINDSTEPLTKKLKSLSSTTYTFVSATPASTVSVATSTLTFPNHEMSVTALRHKGNKQNMHNTNSHLTVDNVNTIVSTKKATTTTTTISTSKRQEQEQQEQQELEQMDEQQKHKKGTTTKLSSQNAHTTSKGSSNGISVGSSSTSSTSNSSGGERNKTNISMEELIAATGNSNRTNTSTTRISARKVDNKSILSKTHKTDAPMLNYIFDTFSSANKHHHHDQRYGPHFEDVQLVGQPTNMTVQAGSSIHLNCRISLLQDKTVSWVRRNSQGENALDLLTVGLHTYTGDKRYKMEFQYPSNWRLKINNVKKDDEATYECQISTHPPRVIQINLHVNAPKVMIVDEFGDPLQEKYYEQDSTLQLSCVVRNVAMSASVVFWKHIEDILNYDVTRGGVSVKTELMDDGANSTLFIAKINKADSGNYTCSISEYQNYTIVVHILNGESFAELHHGGAFSWQQFNYQVWLINLILATTLLLLLPAYVHR